MSPTGNPSECNLELRNMQHGARKRSNSRLEFWTLPLDSEVGLSVGLSDQEGRARPEALEAGGEEHAGTEVVLAVGVAGVDGELTPSKLWKGTYCVRSSKRVRRRPM
eukprot:11221837-Alexandrium_andersonii.AAC.1